MPAVTKSSVAGWDEFIESLRTLPDRMLAKLPEEKRSDPQYQQEIARLALESIASTTIEAIGGNGDFPVFRPAPISELTVRPRLPRTVRPFY